MYITTCIVIIELFRDLFLSLLDSFYLRIGFYLITYSCIPVSSLLQVVGLFLDSDSVINAALTARPNVTAFAYFSSAVNPILYVFAGSSHIRQAGLSFMGKLFDATNSESRTTSTFTRSGRTSSSPDESSVLHTLSVKLGKPFKGKNKERSSSMAGKEVDESEFKTLASVEQVE